MPIDAAFSVLKGEPFHPSVAGYMSRATSMTDQFGAPVGGRVERPDADALNRKLSAWRARPSMKDMQEHLSFMGRPPVVRERFKSPWTEDADTYPPISELQGPASKTPESAMDFHKDPDAPAVGPTGEIDEFAHLTDAQSAAYLPNNPHEASVVGRATGGRYSSMRDTDSPQRISHEFYPEESGMDFRLDRMNPPSRLNERYNELFRRSSDTPIDAAFSVLKPEEDVRKFLPLIIPAAAALYGGYQGVKNVRENKITDPVFGTELGEGDDSFLSNLGEFGTGAAQGFIPGAGLKTALTAGGKRVLSRGAAKQAPKKVAAKRSADKARAAQQQRIGARGQRDELVAMQRQGIPVNQRQINNLNRQVASNRPELLFDEAADAAALARRTGAGHRFAGNTMTSLGKPLTKPGLLATTALAGAAYGGKQIADALGNMSMGGSGTAAPSGSGMGGGQQQQGQFSLAGEPSAGNQNLQNVGVGQTGREQIWQQGGSGTFDQKQKGETMTFTHYDGNEMLRKALEDLDKMHCATAKADCPKCGKDCKCDEKKKADDKKGKKPAHGMVIVIGSKGAGPGPSTDGKRDSKD